MNLDFVRVSHNFSESEKLEAIIKSQFPPKEYLSLENQLSLQDTGGVEIWALYNDNELVGFTTLCTTDDMVYLFFLAFGDTYQGKGYGRKAVEKIKELYSDKTVTVDFELPEENADNKEQRIRRRDFYLRCGFCETGWGLSFLGVRYEVFCMNKPFKMNCFMSMLSTLKIKDFDPKYFKI